MSDKYTIISTHKKFSIARCNLPTRSVEGMSQYALLIPLGGGMVREVATFYAATYEDADVQGLELAKANNLYP
ncbi:MAG: hypothetical protein QHH05_03150 [Syntrophomonadaceae bacterium]|nr:hypothetical protein [Syntrophomonadaceae bacterium]